MDNTRRENTILRQDDRVFRMSEHLLSRWRTRREPPMSNPVYWSNPTVKPSIGKIFYIIFLVSWETQTLNIDVYVSDASSIREIAHYNRNRLTSE